MNANDRYINTIQRVLTFEKYEKDFLFGLPIKTVLNKVRTFANHSSFLARLIYTALNAEMYSCMAKREKIVNHNIRKSGTYYYLKEMYVTELSRLFYTHNLDHPEYLMLYGRGLDEDEDAVMTKVLYFHIPGCQQISYHISNDDVFASVPEYTLKWDECRNTTLSKLRECIWKMFWQELKIEKYPETEPIDLEIPDDAYENIRKMFSKKWETQQPAIIIKKEPESKKEPVQQKIVTHTTKLSKQKKQKKQPAIIGTKTVSLSPTEKFKSRYNSFIRK